MAIREHMLDYVIDLLDDATHFWASAKGQPCGVMPYGAGRNHKLVRYR